MKEIIIEAATINEYPEAAHRFLDIMNDNRIFAFYGKMGAGKTTFIKNICEQMGVEDCINSPTFAIVNEYEAANADTIYHFDFYRIKNIDEVYNMGYEEYLYSNAYCFIEWPELIEELLPEETIKVFIEETEHGSRIIRLAINE
ncbi:MAG: tRNA (adenosine(37)-N6)-threonylcarbamoyltransferase complex ATPase subunit type 1 TsaE [Bacteroidaceae bacterium]|nr:tRNA (adenosine(37)-N6)-threonylcarbamoyltransferase complex ATPase subunit type 1 TsaE [Bacteroidaceae bacterium]